MEVDSTAMAASPLPQPPTLPSSSSSQETQQPSSHERSNFRRELYARSTDRSTVEDMADMVVHRVIGQAATCIERSLGMKFSMENLRLSSMDDDLDEEQSMDTNASTPPLNVVNNENRRNARLLRSRKGKTVEIPNSSQFNKELGPILINRIVDSWDLNCAVWERHVELVNIEDSPTQINYGYKVVFYPMAKAKRYIQITASVDFNLLVNRLDPNSPIKVEFRLEGQRYRHEPGQFRFREKWLLDIIEHKKKLIRQVSL